MGRRICHRQRLLKKHNVKTTSPPHRFCEEAKEEETWHRAIVPAGDPTSIFAAAPFHARVRDGVEVVPKRWRHQENDEGATLKTAREVVSGQWPSLAGQALGRLARLGFICCQTST